MVSSGVLLLYTSKGIRLLFSTLFSIAYNGEIPLPPASKTIWDCSAIGFSKTKLPNGASISQASLLSALFQM